MGHPDVSKGCKDDNYDGIESAAYHTLTVCLDCRWIAP